MDDLIVIILTLVLIVASSLGQLKKKAPGKEKVKDFIPGDNDGLWPLPEEDTAIKPVIDFKEHKNNLEKAREPYQFKDDFTSIKPENISARNIQVHSLKKVKKIKFSLRKAVIYNEILNRKYT